MNSNILPTNTLLQGGRYKIINTLGQGGFGITYLALQTVLDRQVAIKEFFMKDLCNRDEVTSHVSVVSNGSIEMVDRFKTKFLKEARNIARLNHPNIIRILDVFEENGTAYYVMEYAEGGSLADKVKRCGALSESEAVRYILQIADALSYIHEQKMNHLDIKPANIMLNEKDDAILIDFGTSKQYDVDNGNQTSTTPIGVSHGYAPIEQYNVGGVNQFFPQTDIYSLGATLYKLVTTLTPPQACEILNDGLPELPVHLSNETRLAIKSAMEVRKLDRPKDISYFVNILTNKEILAVANNEASKGYLQHNDETRIIDNKNFSISHGVPQSYTEAVKWYLKSAEQGNVIAQYNLGVCYESGRGVPRSYKEAVKWYLKSAEQGNARAQCNLGCCYESGLGVPRSYEEAVKWYLKSAEQGDARAQCNLGYCYDEGLGVPQSYEEAVKWYLKSAEQGNVIAQYNLGVCYESGRGILCSQKKALQCYKNAASQGEEMAILKIVYYLYKGIEIQRERLKSYNIYRRYEKYINEESVSSIYIILFTIIVWILSAIGMYYGGKYYYAFEHGHPYGYNDISKFFSGLIPLIAFSYMFSWLLCQVFAIIFFEINRIVRYYTLLKSIRLNFKAKQRARIIRIKNLIS